MLEVLYPIASESYSAGPGQSRVITTDLPGGLPRTELDFMQGFFSFNVVLDLHKEKYEELLTVYKQFLRKPQPVRFNLVSYGLVEPHLCWFVPTTFKLSQTDAWDNYKVSFSLVGSREVETPGATALKLPFLPEKAGYSYDEAAFRSVQSTIAAPGPSVGAGFANAHSVVNCSFIFTEAEFPVFMQFFEQYEVGTTFLADLIIDTGDLQEYKCKFETESLKITNRGVVYYVSIKILALKVP